jgi:hypothetical protein
MVCLSHKPYYFSTRWNTDGPNILSEALYEPEPIIPIVSEANFDMVSALAGEYSVLEIRDCFLKADRPKMLDCLSISAGTQHIETPIKRQH